MSAADLERGTSGALRLPGPIHDAVMAHALFCAPFEACGLLAADERGNLRMAYCLTNVAHSPTRFTVSPREHYGAMRHAERHGWTIGGDFHSHPGAEGRPSPTDIAGALDPTWVHLIVGAVPRPHVRAFEIRGGEIAELHVDVVRTSAAQSPPAGEGAGGHRGGRAATP